MAQTAPNHDRACRVARVGLSHEVGPHAQQLALTLKAAAGPKRARYALRVYLPWYRDRVEGMRSTLCALSYCLREGGKHGRRPD